MEEALPSKKCFKCGEIKPLSDFYKHPEMPDGHVNKCKECNKKDVRENRKKRENYYNAYDRVRSKTPHRKAQKKKRESRPEVKEHIKKYKQQYEYAAKQRKAAHDVGNAVRDGRLEKYPCWVCGCEDVEGHHPDYDSPLDVIWLCTKHHAEIHRDYNHEDDLLLLQTTEKGNRWDSK